MRRRILSALATIGLAAACGTSGIATPAAVAPTASASLAASAIGASPSVAMSAPTASASVAASATPPAAVTPSPSPSPVPTAAAVEIAGGCGQTPLYAGPGPYDIPGLTANPWAVATPATAGIVAYLWGGSPYLSASPTRPHGESNKVLWQGGKLTSIVGRRLDDPKATARLEFPAPAGPSEIDLPSAGCWHLDLQQGGRTVATIDLAVAPATSARATPLAGCPVTKPTTLFHPPAPALANPPAVYHEAWYGTSDLWTLLPPDGQVWNASQLPNDPSGGVSNKMEWWSSEWSPSKEPSPAIAVSGIELNGGGTFGIRGGTNAISDLGTAMLVGVEFPFRGCWQVTATYRGHSLTHVLWIKP